MANLVINAAHSDFDVQAEYLTSRRTYSCGV